MRKTVRLLATGVLLVFGTASVAAAESGQSTGDASQAGANDTDKYRGNAECPIKKTINGKLYCFQNDPALTKRQGGGN